MTVEAQLQALRVGVHDDARLEYIEILRTTGIDDLTADELHNVVRVCEAAGITLQEFEVDRNVANTLHISQECAGSETHHRKQCAALAKKINKLAGVIPRLVKRWLDLPYLSTDKRSEMRKRETVRQLFSQLIKHQSLLAQALSAKEGLKRQREKFWWLNSFIEKTDA